MTNNRINTDRKSYNNIVEVTSNTAKQSEKQAEFYAQKAEKSLLECLSCKSIVQSVLEACNQVKENIENLFYTDLAEHKDDYENPHHVTAQQVDAYTKTQTDTLLSAKQPVGNYLTEHQDISGKANSADLATVATSGSYNDLSNKPIIPDVQIQSDWSQSDNTAKDYIKNKPTIPAAQVQSNWNETNTSSKAYILNKPTIPTVPTTLSSFTDDLGTSPTHSHSQYLTSHQDISGKEDASNKVTSLSSSSTDTQYPSAKCVYDELADKADTSSLSTVATTGDYDDLTDKPIFSTGLTDSSGTITVTNYDKILKNTSSIPNNSLTINGVTPANTAYYSINIGDASETAISGVSLGSSAKSTGAGSTAIGCTAVASGAKAIQIGRGTNSTARSFCVGFCESSADNSKNYELLDGTTGLIPDARLSSNIARTSDIPAAQVQSNWNETNTSSKAYIQNKPTIPTVGNGTITINQGGVQKGTFTTNQSGNTTIELDSGGSDIDVDDALSTTSENPVQNKVVTGAINGKLDLSGGTIEGNLEVYNDDVGIGVYSVEYDAVATLKSGGLEIDDDGTACRFSPRNIDFDTETNTDHLQYNASATKTEILYEDYRDDSYANFKISNIWNASLRQTEGSKISLSVNDGNNSGEVSLSSYDVTTLHIPTSSSTYANASNDTAVSVKWLKDNAMPLKQDVSNLVTSISSSSTDTQYPSAKCVYDLVGNIETLLSQV